MSDLTAGMQTALSAQTALIFFALRIDLPGSVLRLVDGAATLVFNSETYTGSSEWGAVSGIQPSDDGVGDQVPAMTISLHPASDEKAVELSDPAVQGSEVQLWFGVVDRATGNVIADPYLLFMGEVDQPILTAGQGTSEVQLECVSSMERLFENDEGSRLSDTFHKLLFSGETGLSNVTGVAKKVVWGVEGSAGGSITR